MALKIFKAVWFLSLLAVLAVFMFVYASLQETVIIQDGEQPVVLSKEGFFYMVLAMLALINVVVFIFLKLYKKGHDEFLSWLFGLISVINFFFIIAVSFVNVYNSNEKFDYPRIGFIIYGSVGLILLWIIGWPIYSFFKRFSTKASI